MFGKKPNQALYPLPPIPSKIKPLEKLIQYKLPEGSKSLKSLNVDVKEHIQLLETLEK